MSFILADLTVTTMEVVAAAVAVEATTETVTLSSDKTTDWGQGINTLSITNHQKKGVDSSKTIFHSDVNEAVEARDVRSCEDRCLNARNFDCRSFSFQFMSQPYRNCELSDDSIRGTSDDTLEYDKVNIPTFTENLFVLVPNYLWMFFILPRNYF